MYFHTPDLEAIYISYYGISQQAILGLTFFIRSAASDPRGDFYNTPVPTETELRKLQYMMQ